VVQGGLDHLLHQLFRGVEGRCRRLRDIGHFLAAQTAQRRAGGPPDLAAVQHDLAAGQADAAAPVGQRGQTDGRFARARFPDQPHHLAAFEAERHIVDDHRVARLFPGGVNRRLDAQVADVQKRISHRGLLSGWWCD